MDYLDTMDNHYIHDEVHLFDSLTTDNFFDLDSLDTESEATDAYWFNGFTAPKCSDGLVSDCMMQSNSMAVGINPCVQSEHSYSVSSGTASCTGIKLEPDNDFEMDTMNAINPNLALSGPETDVCDIPVVPVEDIKQELQNLNDGSSTEMKTVDLLNCEDNEISMPAAEKQMSPTFVVTCTTQLMRRQPTIIVTNARQPFSLANNSLARTFIAKSESTCSTLVSRGSSVVKERHKNEHGPVYILTSSCQRNGDEAPLPLTPPASSVSSSSSSSDSECSQSPKRHAPASPNAVQRIFQQQPVSSVVTLQQKHSPSTSSVLSSSGMLILTEEEKRTLIAEGYPVPTRLPLTKQEEKNLKKVQRKIKNKMSAQESRRKKKDYVESLEKKLEASNQENGQLKKQLELLLSDNKSLTSQLHKLQSLANSLSPLQSSTCLAVFILFFAIGIGVWSPFWSSSAMMPSGVPSVQPERALLPSIGSSASDYMTPNLRSRMLKSYEEDVDFRDPSLTDFRHAMLDWFLGLCRPYQSMTTTDSSISYDTSESQLNQPTDTESAVSDEHVSDVLAVVELKSTNNTRTNADTPLNVTYAADIISVLV